MRAHSLIERACTALPRARICLLSLPCQVPMLPCCCRMDEVAGQSRLFAAEGHEVRLPVAHMVCNQSPPVAGKPSLMTFR